MAIGNSTGTFKPYTVYGNSTSDRSGVENNRNGRTIYRIDLQYRKINEIEHIKWCRRNLGDRGATWDFWLAGGVLYIELWDDKAKFAYELWKN
jgi:hypothetical protein